MIYDWGIIASYQAIIKVVKSITLGSCLKN